MTQQLPGTEWRSGRENHAICVRVRKSRRGSVMEVGKQLLAGESRSGKYFRDGGRHPTVLGSHV